MGYSCRMLMTKTSLRETIDKGQGSVAEANVGQSSVDFQAVYYGLSKKQVEYAFVLLRSRFPDIFHYKAGDVKRKGNYVCKESVSLQYTG